jgi:methyl-accepting chemotaxis protein
MSECEKLSECPFFNDQLANMPAIAGMMKKKFCHGTKEECARYMVATKLGKEKVPAELFPNMKERALSILTKS